MVGLTRIPGGRWWGRGRGVKHKPEGRMRSEEYKPLDDSWTWLGLRQLVNLIKLWLLSHTCLNRYIDRQIDFDKV